MPPADPDAVSWARIAIASFIVLALLGAMAAVLKFVTARGFRLPGISRGGQRLRITESLAVDARRRLVIVECDGEEHLLLLGLNQDIVVARDLIKNRLTPLPTSSVS